MNLQPRKQFEVEGDYEILASFDVVRKVQNGVTLDASAVTADGAGDKIVKKGQPIAKVTATGKYVPYNSAGADGSENPTIILDRTVNLRYGDAVVSGYEMAKVISARLPVTVDATLKSKMPAITFA